MLRYVTGLRGITTHIQTKEQTKTNQMTIYNSVGMSVHGCGMSCDWWLCTVCDSPDLHEVATANSNG